MGKPKGRRELPLQSSCDEYQCPCHEKLERLMAVVRSNKSFTLAYEEFVEKKDDK